MNRVEFKKLRTRAKMSQEAFGKVLGVSANTIWQWESGNGSPREGWDSAGLQKKLEKAVGTTAGTNVAAPKVSTPRPSVMDSMFIEALVSTLLDPVRLAQTRTFLLEAERQELDIGRLLNLLGAQ